MAFVKTMKWAGLATSAVLAAAIAGPVAAQTAYDGCPSGPILSGFEAFGRTGKMPPALGKWLGNVEAQAVTPWKPFDNVDYVGICWVSAWLVHTDDGIVLIDTLYGPYTEPMIERIKGLGVDLADIKYVLMTHGHRDHVGGASVLKPVLPNATFVMTQVGWDEALKSAEQSKGGRREFTMIDTDKVVTDGETISLGGNAFTVIETPGHTWGTASYMYDVKDGDDTYRSITIGGLGLNAIEGPSQVEAYIESVDRVRAMVESPEDAVQVHLTTHGFSANLQENRAILEERKPGEPNVFVNSDAILSDVARLRGGAVMRLGVEKSK